MAAHEEQDERVVPVRFMLHVGRGHDLVHLHGRGSFPAPAGQFAAQVVGHAPGGNLDQPAAWIVGSALPGPLQLIFNEGYTSSVGSHLQRHELSSGAIRLTRTVHALLPDDAEVAGLLALMLLTDARRAARSGPDGELIPLTKQDRALWDREEISAGIALLSATLPKGSIGAYQIQAAIAAVHDEAARAEDTDWPQILALYDLLRRVADNPIVMLNHAVAAAMVHGPPAGLKLLDALDADGRLKGHYRLDAVRAHLLELAGDHQAATAHYLQAAGRTTSVPQRNYLLTQAARLRESADERR